MGVKKFIRTLVSLLICFQFSACISASNNASITLAGEVIDQLGRPLAQVRLNERTSRFSLRSESLLSSTTSAEDLDDGRFRITCNRCSSIEISFSKQGYYSETLVFHVEKRESSNGRLSTAVAIDMERSDLQVVLRSNENRANLIRYEGYLRSTAAGPVTVAPLRRDLGSRGVQTSRLSQAPDSDANYLPGYISLLAASTDQLTLSEQARPEVRGAYFPIPLPPVLDFSEADGGIVLYELTEENPRSVYRAMVNAPLDGYQDSLELPTLQRSGVFYFYCRIGDLYGKGRVGLPSFGHADDGQEVVGAYIEIRLNMDGSRNLETSN